MPVIGDIDFEFHPTAMSGGEAKEVDNAASEFQDAMAASLGASRDPAPSSRNQPSNPSASDRSRAPQASGRGARRLEYAEASGSGGAEPARRVVAPSPIQGRSGDNVRGIFGPMATDAHSSAAPDHPPRLLSPLSREFLGNFTPEGLVGTHIEDLSHQVNQNREAYTLDHQQYSVASVKNFVDPVKRTINSLRNRVSFENDEPVADIFRRISVLPREPRNGCVPLQPQRRFGEDHLRDPSDLPPLGAAVRLNPSYMSPDGLPGPSEENAAAGTRTYGSVTVHGGPDAWTAYQNVREFATQSGSAHDQGREVIATIENTDMSVHVHPYKIRQGMAAKNYPNPGTQVNRRPAGVWSEVFFPLNQGWLSANGSRSPPVVLALHELQHAMRARACSAARARLRGNFTNDFEYDAINGAEAGALEALGEKRRDSHTPGFFYQTTGQTSMTAANPDVEKTYGTAIPELRKLTAELDDYRVDQSNPPVWDFGGAGAAQRNRDWYLSFLGGKVADLEGHG
jgi:hypothetical protein